MTNLPFGVTLTFLPAVTPPDYPGYIKAIIDGTVRIVETAGNNPQKWLPLRTSPQKWLGCIHVS
jgi:nitronate monooxygenase